MTDTDTDTEKEFKRLVLELTGVALSPSQTAEKAVRMCEYIARKRIATHWTIHPNDSETSVRHHVGSHKTLAVVGHSTKKGERALAEALDLPQKEFDTAEEAKLWCDEQLSLEGWMLA
jgi:hypothetical protein